MKKHYNTIKNLTITVISILVLFWIIAPTIPCDIDSKSKENTMCLKMNDIKKRILNYKTNHSTYPSNNKGLSFLLQNDLKGKPYLKKIPKDIWRTPFAYIKLENSFELISYGADKRPNTKDDIYLSKCKEK